MGNIVDFINKGGNVLLVGSDQVSEALKDFAFEFSVDLKTTKDTNLKRL
jgi:oligosaccharyltransferase complex subunit beta